MFHLSLSDTRIMILWLRNNSFSLGNLDIYLSLREKEQKQSESQVSGQWFGQKNCYIVIQYTIKCILILDYLSKMNTFL